MSENIPGSEPSQDPGGSGDAWQDVGRQFQKLGESIATAFKVSVNNTDNRRRLQEMQAGLESMANNVNQAIKEAAESPKLQEVREDARRATSAVRQAGEQTVQDMRPFLLTALKDLNTELDRLIRHMQPKAAQDEETEDTTTNPT